MGEPRFVGIDVGGTKSLAVVATEDGSVLARKKRRTPSDVGGDELSAFLVDLLEALLGKAELSLGDVESVGVAIPGPIDAANGLVRQTVNMAMHAYPLRDALESKLDVPAAIVNDVSAGVLAEYRYGAAKGFRHVVGIYPGTGIGGGVVVDGVLLEGKRGGAGEIGHVTVQAGGRICGCGNRGCLEAHASKTAIAKDLIALAATGRAPTVAAEVGGDFGKLRSGVIRKAVEAGDPAVVEVVERAAWYLGIGMAAMVNIFDPEVVVIGGGLVEQLGDWYMDRAAESMRSHAMVSLVEDVEVRVAALGDDSVALGAAIVGLTHADREDGPRKKKAHTK